MPTGYTSLIEEGKVKTAKQFLNVCIRAFWPCGVLRDSDLNTQADLTKQIGAGYDSSIKYHKTRLADAQRRLSEIDSIPDDVLYDKYVKDMKSKLEYYTEEQKKDKKNNTRYSKIEDSIKKWDCPEDFAHIKKFALEQIDMSKSKTDYWGNEIAKLGEPTPDGFAKYKDKYLQDLKKSAEWDYNYHKGELDQLVVRKAEAVEFYKKFREEITKIED